MLFTLVASLLVSASALQAGVPMGCSRPRHACTAPAVSMSVPWRLAGAVGVAGSCVGLTSLAVKTVLNKQAEAEAAKGRAALLAMGGVASGDSLDLPRSQAKHVVIGDWKVYTKFDGRVFYEHIPTRKQQWRKPEELAGLEEVDALTSS